MYKEKQYCKTRIYYHILIFLGMRLISNQLEGGQESVANIVGRGWIIKRLLWLG